MKKTGTCRIYTIIAVATILGGPGDARAQEPPSVSPEAPAFEPVADPEVTKEQGQTRLDESFDWEARRERIREERRQALADTVFNIQLRSMYLDREKYDDSESEAWAAGGSAGLKTGYFRDLLAIGATGYTSQRVTGDKEEDGTLLLRPGQHGYTVLGELYGDLKILDSASLFAGRKAYDTPYINRNDTRMTPNTFEAATLQGRFGLDKQSAIKYGGGHFTRIKERNDDDFVWMSEDAGATVERGVTAAGAIYERGPFSIGGIDYYSEDIINIAYGEVKHTFPVSDRMKLGVAGQVSDQRSTGDDLLQGDEFSAAQYGVKGELGVWGATFTVAYTTTESGDNMQSPWSGYPGYTSVQVEDFNRAGEDAVMLRAAYTFRRIPGLSAYALWVAGTDPDDPNEYARDEYNANLQWKAPKGYLDGLALRTRYAVVTQNGGDDDDLQDFRAILTYDVPWGK